MIESTYHPLSQNIGESGSMGYFLPKGLIRVSLKPPIGKPNEYELKVEAKLIPDPEHFYRLSYLPNPAAKDNLKVSIANGFLQSVETTAKDEMVDIAKRIMEIPKEIAKAALGAPAAAIAPPGLKQSLDVDVDPDIFFSGRTEDKKIVNNLKKNLESFGIIEIKITRPPGAETYKAAPPSKGVYYRPLLPYTVKLSYKGKTKTSPTKTTSAEDGPSQKPADGKAAPSSSTSNPPKKETSPKKQKAAKTKAAPQIPPNAEYQEVHVELQETVYLPNGAPILSLDVTRAAFVTKKTKLTFADGVLTGVDLEKPSEILAGLEIPIHLIKTIVSLPSDIIQLKINYSSQEKAWLDQQFQEMKARDAIVDYGKSRKETGKEGKPFTVDRN